MIEYVVTGMVLRKPLTGYEIKQEIEAGIGNFYKSSYGNLYPALKKLTDKGYLTLTEQTQVDRLKKYYVATELGKAAFLEWLTSPIGTSSVTVPMLIRIYFFRELPEDLRRKQIQKYEAHVQKVLRVYREMEKHIVTESTEKVDYYELSTLYYGLLNAQGMLRWLKYVREQKPLSELTSEEAEPDIPSHAPIPGPTLPIDA